MLEFTAWPEMLAWPYLMLQGWLPYRDIAIAHNPLLLLDLLVFFKIFGIGIIQLKIYTWILIAINVYLTYFISNKFWNKKVALVSSFLYLVLCIVYQGNGLWFDLALTPFALLLYLFLKQKNYLWSGIIFALGFLTKQTFIYFLIPLILIKINWKKFILGTLLIGSIFVAMLFGFGILDDFYIWAIQFGIFYLPKAEGQILLPTLKQFLFAIAPFGILVFDVSLLPWIIAGIMGVYPRWELFHFQPALPFLSIAISTLIYSNKSKYYKIIVSLFAVCYLLIGLNRQFGNNTRFYEPDVQKVQQSIIQNNDSTIYVVNYWDNIYTLTNTLPATKPLIPYIPWYLNYKNSREKILNDLKIKMPEAIIIGERDIIFPELYEFVDRYYSCNIVEKKVELCEKN